MRLGAALRTGDAICLQGELGAGKTTFIQGVAQGWGSMDPVSSPTFVIVNVYRRADSNSLFHLDAYRVESINEADELDIHSMMDEGPLLLEWAERIKKIIPNEHLWIYLSHVAEEHRQMKFQARGARYESLLTDLRQNIFGGG